MPGRRKFPAWFYLLLIAGAGFLLRLGVSFELAGINGGRNSVFTPSPLSDLHTYMKLAREIAEGTFSGEFYYQPFYYAVFLPAIRILSGGSIWAVIVVQALLGAAAVYLAGLIAARLWSRRAGFIAAAFTAISTPLLLYTPYCQNETLQSFQLTLLFYLALRTVERGGPWRYAATGALLGVCVLTRGNANLLLPGLLALLVRAEYRRNAPNGTIARRIAVGIAALLGLFLIVQLPFIIHNSAIRGRLCGPSTAADAVLALGNTPEAPPGGRNPGLPAGPMEYPAAYADFMARAAAGRPVARQMLDWLHREPGAFLELQFRKALLFWDYREIPNNVSLYGEGTHSRLLGLALPGRSGVLLPFVLAGLFSLGIVAIRRRKSGLLLLYWFVLVYWGATALFYILSRFRAPILPLAFIFAGIFLDRAIRTFGRDRRKFYRRIVPALLCGFFVSVSAVDFYREQLEAAAMRLVRPDGTAITLLSGATVRFDHGPFTDGDWQLLPLAAGTVVEKTFARWPGAREAEVEITILGEPGRTLRYRLNGVRGEYRQESPGQGTIRQKAPVDGGTIRFEALGGEDFSLIFDARRRYGRTRVDGRMLNGEAVMRVTCRD